MKDVLASEGATSALSSFTDAHVACYADQILTQISHNRRKSRKSLTLNKFPTVPVEDIRRQAAWKMQLSHTPRVSTAHFIRSRPLPRNVGNIVSSVCFIAARQRFYSTPKAPPPSAGPLAGIRVLDFTRVLAGPFCTQILADYGAHVTKVEQLGGEETRKWRGAGEDAFWKSDTGPMSLYFAALNRSKRSITLDLKSPAGIEVVKRLAKDFDVVVENFVPGTADRLGIGYSVLSELNPKLVYASISGYGPTGPYANKAGYDAIAAAETGFMHCTGHPNSPPVRAAFGMTDMSTGLFAHGAIMAALLARGNTGRGQFVSASLWETQLAMTVNVGGNWMNRQVEGGRYGAAHPSAVPYNAWKCGDGVYLVVAANSDKQFVKLCERIERKDLLEDDRFKTNAIRVQNRQAIDDILAGVFENKSSDEWMKAMEGSGLAHGPVNTMERAFQHPQIKARRMIQPVEWEAAEEGSWKTLGVPVKFSETSGEVRGPPSLAGQHSEEVLKEAGFSEKEIAGMKHDGVI